MTKRRDLGGSFTLPGTSMTLNRMGYGAMQLAGPGVWGPPRDVDGAIAVLQEAVTVGVNHIDTSDFYGPHYSMDLMGRATKKRDSNPYPVKPLILKYLWDGAEGGDSQTLLFYAAFQVFLIYLSIPTFCVIALFTPFVLTGLFCDSDVTPNFQA